MAYEILVGLQVTDDEIYQNYRSAMTPILKDHGGYFRYDFKVDETLKSESSHPINRVFTIHFPNKDQKEKFFSHERYLEAKKKYFEDSVSGVTIIAEYQI